MEKGYMYHSVTRKGRKWETVAVLNQAGCLAVADDVFRSHGFNGETVWGSRIESQKNWAGFSPSCKILTETEEEATAIFHARIDRDLQKIREWNNLMKLSFTK